MEDQHTFKETNYKNMLSVKFTDFIKVEQPADRCVLSCRFSLSEAGADMARQLRDRGDASPSRPLADAAPCIIPIHMSGDGYADGAAASNGDIATTCMSHDKEYHSAISVKRKTTAKTKDCKNSRPSLVSTVSHITIFHHFNGVGLITHDSY
jgi:hypothetical protein